MEGARSDLSDRIDMSDIALVAHVAGNRYNEPGRKHFETRKRKFLRMLVVEDQKDQIGLLRFACVQAEVNLPMQFVTNGVEAVAYLKGEGKFADRTQYPIPKLMLLNLSMPLMDGFQVLEWVRKQPELRKIPIIVFTTSARLQDVKRAFELGASFYLVKPVELHDLERTMRCLQDYYLALDERSDSSASLKLPPDLQPLLRNPQQPEGSAPVSRAEDDTSLRLY